MKKDNKKVATFGVSLFLFLFSLPCIAQWQELEDMPAPLGAIDPVVYDGKVYVFGGKITEIISSDTVWVYDPDSGWSFGGKMPDSLEAIAIEEFGGKFYLFGGHSHPDFVYRNEVMTYDPATQLFDTIGHMPVAIAWPASAVLNGKIYLMGGDNGTSSSSKAVYIFDPANPGNWNTGPSLNADRVGAAADTLDGKIYLTGGGSLTSATAYQSMEIFDSNAGVWITSPALMNTGRAFHSCKNANGKLYVAGGAENVFSAPDLKSTEYFKPQQGGWVVFDDMKYSRRELGAAILPQQDTVLLYVFGGRIGPFGNGASHAKVEKYGLIVGVTGRNTNLPSVALSPNPFSTQTTITYELKSPAEVLIQVFDLSGRAVATLFDGRQGAGAYSVTWDAAGMPAGVYCYRLQTNEGVVIRKCVLQNH